MAYLKRFRVSALAGLALAGALTLAACATTTGGGGGYGGYGGSTTTTSSAPVNLSCASGAVVCTKSVSVSGQAKTVLATTQGMTLYYFMPDTATTSACSGSCASLWPALTTTGSSVTGSGFSGTLSTLNDSNGDQVLYNGHPLYTYSGDKSQSDANGEGIGGKWHAAYPGLAASSGSAGYGYAH